VYMYVFVNGVDVFTVIVNLSVVAPVRSREQNDHVLSISYICFITSTHSTIKQSGFAAIAVHRFVTKLVLFVELFVSLWTNVHVVKRSSFKGATHCWCYVVYFIARPLHVYDIPHCMIIL
jgi:hypothetical protein